MAARVMAAAEGATATETAVEGGSVEVGRLAACVEVVAHTGRNAPGRTVEDSEEAAAVEVE